MLNSNMTVYFSSYQDCQFKACPIKNNDSKLNNLIAQDKTIHLPLQSNSWLYRVSRISSRYPSKKKNAAREIGKQLKDNDIIKRSVSNWFSHTVWVPKSCTALTEKKAEERNIKYVPLSKDKTAQQSLRLAINFKTFLD